MAINSPKITLLLAFLALSHLFVAVTAGMHGSSTITTDTHYMFPNLPLPLFHNCKNAKNKGKLHVEGRVPKLMGHGTIDK